MPPEFWQPKPMDLSFVLLSLCSIISWYLGYYYWRKFKRCQKKLDSFKSYSEPDNILPNPQSSPTVNATINDHPSKGDTC